MFWKVHEILYQIGTEISQIGQREAEEIEIEDSNLISKIGLFSWTIENLTNIGI